MLTKQLYLETCHKTLHVLKNAGIELSVDEMNNIEIVEYGLGMIDEIGLQLVVYENNDQYCAKELVLFSHQTCPEHKHPPIADKVGKKETFRCRKGEVYLYVEGDSEETIKAIIPKSKKDCFTVFNEIILRPGDQFTIPSNTLHWFQSGPEGAVISEFSSSSYDEGDIYTDPEIDAGVKRTVSCDESDSWKCVGV